MSHQKTVLVTGANRGIGHEVCRQLALKGLRVLLTARRAEAALEAAAPLRAEGLDVSPEVLDVSEDASVAACVERLGREGRRIDVLVNNAAISGQGSLLSPPALEAVMAVNFFGAVRTCAAFVPGMLEAGYGRVVNVSSGCGSYSEGLPGEGACYAISKAALNAYTVRLARKATGDVKVNAVCPGWVRTRMGGASAPRSVEEGVDSIVWLATVGADGPTGGFFRDRSPIGF